MTSQKATFLFASVAVSLLFGCVRKGFTPVEKTVNADTVSTTQIVIPEAGTVIRTSAPFRINGLECYWEMTDTVDGGTADLLKLRNAKNRNLLLRRVECCLKYGFDFEAKDHFKDVNFDGFEDFLIRSYGSTAENEITNVYLFNPAQKRFDYSEELSDNSIEVDSIKKILITGSFGRDFEITKHHRFHKSGKLKSTEIFKESLEYAEGKYYQIRFTDYEKVVNGKTVATKHDSVVEPEE